MKARNLHIHTTPERAVALKEEYDYIARNATRLLEPGHLVVLALRPKRSKPKKDEDEKGQRDDRRTNGYGRGGKR